MSGSRRRGLKFRPAPVNAESAALLRMMLSSDVPATVKSALQRACDLMETGQAFQDTRFLETALHTHLKSTDLKVRRWSYKLAGRLRLRSLLPLLRKAIDNEATVDAENRSWAVAAFIGYASAPEREQLIAYLGSEFHQTALELASRFFSIGEPLPYRQTLEMRHLEQDRLARQWLSMLAGYAATEPRTIHREFSDLDIVRDAVLDDDAELVEYAIWAENRHPKGSYSRLRAKPEDLLEHENVRRWLFQLLTKNEKAARQHLDLILDRMDHRHEPSELAREGLALGIGRVSLHKVPRASLDWFENEPSLRVKLALVDHLATRARRGDLLALRQLQERYESLPQEDLLAMKIDAASDPDWLAGIKARRGRSSLGFAGDQLDLFVPKKPTILNQAGGVVNVTNNKTIIQSGNNNSIAGVNMGQMTASSLNALAQNQDQSIAAAVPVMEQFVRSLAAEPALKGYDKEAGAELVKEIVEAPTKEARTNRLAKLKSFAAGLLAAPGVGQKFLEDGQELVETVTALLT